MSPEVLSTGTILVGLVSLDLSVGVLQRQTASPVMATEAIPKPFLEAVPEFTPERVPVTTFNPRRAVGLMTSPEWTSDSEPRPERPPVPVDSLERAPVPEFSPRRAPVPEFNPRRAPVSEFSPRRALVPEFSPEWAPVPESSPERAPAQRELLSPDPAQGGPLDPRFSPSNFFFGAPAVGARPLAKATEGDSPWLPGLHAPPWLPGLHAPPWLPGLHALPWPTELPAPP